MFINGKWIDSASGATSQVLNPAAEDVIAVVPQGTLLARNGPGDAARR